MKRIAALLLLACVCNALKVIPESLELSYTVKDEGSFSITLMNEGSKAINATLYVSGQVRGFVSPATQELTISPNSAAHVNFSVHALLTGMYSGNIIIYSDEWRGSIPLTLWITPEKLEMSLDVSSKSVYAGDVMVAMVHLKSYGKVNTTISLRVENPDGVEILGRYDEVEVDGDRELTYRLEIPANSSDGIYIVNVSALYDGRSVGSKISIEVYHRFPLEIVLTSMAIASGAGVGGIWIREVIMDYRRKRIRYALAQGYTNLPKGELWVGRIAEKRAKVGFSIKDVLGNVLVTGATGAGKSVACMVFAEELLRRGIPVIVCDPTMQWSGFMLPCKDRGMLKKYRKFGLRPEDARSFRTRICEVHEIDLRSCLTLVKIDPSRYDEGVADVMRRISDLIPGESKEIRCVLVVEEVHRLLQRYGGNPECYKMLEVGVREFRSKGVGMIMTSHLLSDFSEEMRSNVLTEIQMHTKALEDISSIREKYGEEYAMLAVKLEVGDGMIHNPNYNDGKPFFVSFRPTLHEPHKVDERGLKAYMEIRESISRMLSGDLTEAQKRLIRSAERALEEGKIEVARGLIKLVK